MKHLNINIKIKLTIIGILIAVITYLFVLPMPERIEKIERFTKRIEGIYYLYLPFGFSKSFLDDFTLEMDFIGGWVSDSHLPDYYILANGKGECKLTIFHYNNPDSIINYSVPIENIEQIILKSYDIGFYSIDFKEPPPTDVSITTIDIHTRSGQKHIFFHYVNHPDIDELYEFKKYIYDKLMIEDYLY